MHFIRCGSLWLKNCVLTLCQRDCCPGSINDPHVNWANGCKKIRWSCTTQSCSWIATIRSIWSGSTTTFVNTYGLRVGSANKFFFSCDPAYLVILPAHSRKKKLSKDLQYKLRNRYSLLFPTPESPIARDMRRHMRT